MEDKIKEALAKLGMPKEMIDSIDFKGGSTPKIEKEPEPVSKEQNKEMLDEIRDFAFNMGVKRLVGVGFTERQSMELMGMYASLVNQRND